MLPTMSRVTSSQSSIHPRRSNTRIPTCTKPFLPLLLCIGLSFGFVNLANSYSFSTLGRKNGSSLVPKNPRFSIVLYSEQSDDEGDSVENPRTLKEILLPSSKCNVDQMSGTELGTSLCHNGGQTIIFVSNSFIFPFYNFWSLYWGCCVRTLCSCTSRVAIQTSLGSSTYGSFDSPRWVVRTYWLKKHLQFLVCTYMRSTVASSSVHYSGASIVSFGTSQESLPTVIRREANNSAWSQLCY